MGKRRSSGSSSVSLSSAQNGYEGNATNACRVCNKFSTCICKRCGDYYCSPECQRMDWPQHRFICFKMPELILASSLKTMENKLYDGVPRLTISPEASQTTYEQNMNAEKDKSSIKQNGCKNNNFSKNKGATTSSLASSIAGSNQVIITGFRSSNRCFVRYSNKKEENAYLLVLKKIDSYGKTAPPLKALPKVNSYAIAQKDNALFRVQILSIRSENSIRVLFIDIGTTSLRDFSRLREISDEMVELPQHAKMVQLKNVSNHPLISKIVNFLVQYVDKEFMLKYCKGDERGGNACLFNESEESLNEIIENFYISIETTKELSENEKNTSGSSQNGNKEWRDADEQKTTKNKNVIRREHDSQKRDMEANAISGKTDYQNATKDKTKDSQRTQKQQQREHEYQNRFGEDNVVSRNEDTTKQNASTYKNGNHYTQQNPKNLKEYETQERSVSESKNSSSTEKKSEHQRSQETTKQRQESKERCVKEPFLSIPMEEGAVNTPVIILDNSMLEVGYISCIPAKDIRKLGELQKYLHNLQLNKEPPYTPILNEYCVAKFDNEWYRAKVIDIVEENEVYIVMYCDFGNTENLKVADIRQYPKGLKEDCRTNICLIEGLPEEPNQKQKSFMLKALECQSEIVIDEVRSIVTGDPQVLVVTISSIIKQMKDEHLI